MSYTKPQEDLLSFTRKIILLLIVILFILTTTSALIYFLPKSKSDNTTSQGISTNNPSFFQSDLVDKHIYETFYGNQQYKIAKYSREFIDPIDETKKYYPEIDINGTYNDAFEFYNEYPGARIGDTTYYYASMSKRNNDFTNISDFDIRYFKNSDVSFPYHHLHPITNEDIFINFSIEFDKKYNIELIDQKTNEKFLFKDSLGLNINYIKKDYIDGEGNNHKNIIYKITSNTDIPIMDSGEFVSIYYKSNDFSKNTGEYQIIYDQSSNSFLNNIYFNDKEIKLMN